MYRIKCSDFHEPYLFLRKNTIVRFGNSNRLHGAILMSNPGSYSPKFAERNWQEYRDGKGADKLWGWGFPDFTMQNVIQALQVASNRAAYPLDGYIEIHNLSAIVQPKGEDAEAYHQAAHDVLLSNGKQGILTEEWLESRESFLQYIRSLDDRFLIVGFAERLFQTQQRKVQAWARECGNVYYAQDEAGRWSHPRRWRTDPRLANEIQGKLERHFLKVKPPKLAN